MSACLAVAGAAPALSHATLEISLSRQAHSGLAIDSAARMPRPHRETRREHDSDVRDYVCIHYVRVLADLSNREAPFWRQGGRQ
jgi:hypothetical protein